MPRAVLVNTPFSLWSGATSRAVVIFLSLQRSAWRYGSIHDALISNSYPYDLALPLPNRVVAELPLGSALGASFDNFWVFQFNVGQHLHWLQVFFGLFQFGLKFVFGFQVVKVQQTSIHQGLRGQTHDHWFLPWSFPMLAVNQLSRRDLSFH